MLDALDARPQHAQLLDQNLDHQHRAVDDGAVGGERTGGADFVTEGLELFGGTAGVGTINLQHIQARGLLRPLKAGELSKKIPGLGGRADLPPTPAPRGNGLSKVS